MHGGLLVSVLVVVLAGCVHSTSVPAAWGVHAQDQLVVVDGELDQAAQGFSVFRTFFNWTLIEYQPGQYNFTGASCDLFFPSFRFLISLQQSPSC